MRASLPVSSTRAARSAARSGSPPSARSRPRTPITTRVITPGRRPSVALPSPTASTSRSTFSRLSRSSARSSQSSSSSHSPARRRSRRQPDDHRSRRPAPAPTRPRPRPRPAQRAWGHPRRARRSHARDRAGPRATRGPDPEPGGRDAQQQVRRSRLTAIYPFDMEGGLLDSEGWFEESAQDALDSLPSDLRARMSNVEIVIEDEPPPGQRLLGLYQGIPLTRRGSSYGGVLPDKITIYRGPLTRL